jgi:hypothetical protein
VDVPAGAPVQLDYDFKPELLVRDFFDQWGKFRFVVVYDGGSSYEHEFSEVRALAQRQFPNAFGPQVYAKRAKMIIRPVVRPLPVFLDERTSLD